MGPDGTGGLNFPQPGALLPSASVVRVKRTSDTPMVHHVSQTWPQQHRQSQVFFQNLAVSQQGERISPALELGGLGSRLGHDGSDTTDPHGRVRTPTQLPSGPLSTDAHPWDSPTTDHPGRPRGPRGGVWPKPQLIVGHSPASTATCDKVSL